MQFSGRCRSNTTIGRNQIRSDVVCFNRDIEFGRIFQHDVSEWDGMQPGKSIQGIRGTYWMVSAGWFCLSAFFFPFGDRTCYHLPITLFICHSSRFPISPARASLTISDRFETNWFTPYVIPYQLTRLIAVVFSIETAGRIVLSIYLLATPLMLFRLFNVLGKSGILALPAFLMLFNFNLSWGFLPFLTAIPILIETISQCIRYMHKPEVYRGVLIAGLFVILFFTHLFALIISIFLCFFVIISAAIVKSKPALTFGYAFFPVAGLVLTWRLLLHFNASDRYFLDKGIRFAPFGLKFRFFPDYVISGDPGWTSRVIFFILILLICIRFVPDRRSTISAGAFRCESNPDNTVSDLLNRNIQIGLVIGVWLFYILCPYSWLTAVWLFHRVAFLVMALTLTLLPRQAWVPISLWTIAIVAACITLSWKTTMRHNDFNAEAGAGMQVMRRIPPG